MAEPMFLQNAREIAENDMGLRNKFRLEWLEEIDPNGDRYADWTRKTGIMGCSFCLYCQVYINYRNCGKMALINHSKSVKHRQKRRDSNLEPETASSTVTPCDPVILAPASRNRSTRERIMHLEAATLMFVAEHNLDLSLVPHLIEFAQFLSRDYKVLQQINMTKNSATYKMTEGLGPALHTKLIFDLKRSYFSINIAQCTNKADKFILEVMVQYYSDDEKSVVCKHYKAFEIPVLSADAVHQAVVDQFKADAIPLSNIISMLSDSAVYLKWPVEGFESKLKTVAPNLVDIGDDSVHTVHKVVKKLYTHFDNTLVEKLCDDIFNDSHFCPTLSCHLHNLCKEVTFEKYQKPKERSPENPLCVLESIDIVLHMFNALLLLYWKWLPEENKTNKELLKQFEALKPKNMTSLQVKILESVHNEESVSPETVEEKGRRVRIAEQLWLRRNNVLVYLYFFSAILKGFSAYITTIQTNKPMIHKIHEEQERLLKWFLSLFINTEDIIKFNDNLQGISLSDPTTHRPLEELIIGVRCKKVLQSLPEDDAFRKEFLEKVQEAYIKTAIYFHPKFASNQLLKHLSALDPKVIVSPTKQEQMKLLLQDLPGLLREEEYMDFEWELKALQTDERLPKWDAHNMQLDEWWGPVMAYGPYPCVGNIVKAALSIMTSSSIGEILSEINQDLYSGKTTRASMKTINAMHTVNTYLRSKRKLTGPYRSTSLNLMYREDVVRDPVDSIVCTSMQRAHQAYVKEKRDNATTSKQPGKDSVPAKTMRMAEVSPEVEPSEENHRHCPWFPPQHQD